MLTHEEALNAVLTTVDIIASSPEISELELVEMLETIGFSHLHAEKLCIFVPSAFAWALYKHFGATTFPSSYAARSAAGDWFYFPIKKEHYFTAALVLASDAMEKGWNAQLTQEKFIRVVVRSGLYGCLEQALKDGAKSMAGVEIAPSHLIRISAEEADESAIPDESSH